METPAAMPRPLQYKRVSINIVLFCTNSLYLCIFLCVWIDHQTEELVTYDQFDFRNAIGTRQTMLLLKLKAG